MFVGFFFVESGLIDKIRNIEIIAWTTIIFGILLYISDKFKTKNNIKNNFDYKAVLFIGLLQILSLVPGVSRSGIAITAARFLNFKRTDSAKISFLISIPILGAVTIFGCKNLIFSESMEFTKLNLVSVIISFIFSYLTIKYFLKYIEKFNLNIFVYYRIFLGLLLFTLAYL
jgi:undecaprenyl-diphosphatase